LLAIEHAAQCHREAAIRHQRERAQARAAEAEGGGEAQPRSIQEIRRAAQKDGGAEHRDGDANDPEGAHAVATSPAALCSGASTLTLAVLWQFEPPGSDVAERMSSSQPLLDLDLGTNDNASAPAPTRNGQHHVRRRTWVARAGRVVRIRAPAEHTRRRDCRLMCLNWCCGISTRLSECVAWHCLASSMVERHGTNSC
jgi:hypothetical protein